MVAGKSAVRLYGASIAIVAGAHSVQLVRQGPMGGVPSMLMLLLGGITLLHGGLLLTYLAEWIGSRSGPLMLLYAVIMLLNQTWLVTDASLNMEWDLGMAALSGLMLISGLIMTFHSESMDSL